jgi:hypothetical protein
MFYLISKFLKQNKILENGSKQRYAVLYGEFEN